MIVISLVQFETHFHFELILSLKQVVQFFLYLLFWQNNVVHSLVSINLVNLFTKFSELEFFKLKTISQLV